MAQWVSNGGKTGLSGTHSDCVYFEVAYRGVRVYITLDIPEIFEIFGKRYIYSALHIPSQFYKFSKFSQKHLYKLLSKAISVG